MSTSDWPEIFFIRHGQTAWNAEARFQGQRDIPLNAIGQAQADANGRALAAYLAQIGSDPRALGWYASPMLRASETMQRVRAAFVPPLPEIVYDTRLVELSFGVMEGHLLGELALSLPEEAARRSANQWLHRPEGGENYEDLQARIRAFRYALRGPAVVVAHGGVLRTFRHLIEGIPGPDLVKWIPPQDAIIHFANGTMRQIGGGENNLPGYV